MRLLLLLIFAFFLASVPTHGQAQSADGEVTAQPVCFVLRNAADRQVNGSVVTNFYTRADGIRARHRNNFRLQARRTRSPETGNFTDRAEFCSRGPFYPGRKVEVILRTLVPVFRCKTNIERGEIVIRSETRADDSVKLWAECYE